MVLIVELMYTVFMKLVDQHVEVKKWDRAIFLLKDGFLRYHKRQGYVLSYTSLRGNIIYFLKGMYLLLLFT